jgi:hypothetical protein
MDLDGDAAELRLWAQNFTRHCLPRLPNLTIKSTHRGVDVQRVATLTPTEAAHDTISRYIHRTKTGPVG